jgi:hypothetical protein
MANPLFVIGSVAAGRAPRVHVAKRERERVARLKLENDWGGGVRSGGGVPQGIMYPGAFRTLFLQQYYKKS